MVEGHEGVRIWVWWCDEVIMSVNRFREREVNKYGGGVDC